MKKLIYIICLAAVIFGFAANVNPASVSAYASSTRGTIVNFADTEIPIDAVVHNIVVFGGNLTIAGRVTDEVVVINGSVILESTANIKDRIVVIGGDITSQDGATVGKGIYQIGRELFSANSPLTSGLIIAAGTLLLIWLVNTALAIVLVALPLAIALLWKNTVSELSSIITSAKLKAVFMGILGGIILLSLIILIGITGIGIPLTLLLILFSFIAIIFGLTGLCFALGNILPAWWQHNKELTTTLNGAVLLVMIINLPAVGLLGFLIFIATALGAVLIKLLTKKTNEPI